MSSSTLLELTLLSKFKLFIKPYSRLFHIRASYIRRAFFQARGQPTRRFVGQQHEDCDIGRGSQFSEYPGRSDTWGRTATKTHVTEMAVRARRAILSRPSEKRRPEAAESGPIRSDW